MRRGAHLCRVAGGQGGGHLGDRPTGNGVGPIGGHVAERDQDKGAVLQAGMGQDQPIGGKAALILHG